MKKRMRNNKGFSMVELLAAVAILGLLSALAIVGVGSILDRAENNHYETQQKNLILAAQSYAQDNRNILPKEIGDTKTITLKELQNRKYIGAVVDRSKNACTEGSVTIFKYSKDGYSYRAYLKCDTKTLGTSPDEAVPGPKVTVNAGGTYKEPYFTYAINSIDDAGVDNGKIISYSYQIYNNTVLVRDSGSVSVSNAASLDEKKVSLKDLVPGKFTIVFQATNEYGGITTVTKKDVEYQDPDGPQCGEISPIIDSWQNIDQVTISVTCYDDSGSGCAKEVFSQVFTSENSGGEIIIVNNAGKKTSCPVNVYIDRTAPNKPTLSATDGFPEGTWKNTSFTLTVTSSDERSGVAYYQYCYPGSDGVCEESEWKTYNGSVRTGDDLETGEYTFVTPVFSIQRSEKVAIRAVDKAENKSDPEFFQINIDKTVPNKPTLSATDGFPEGTWKNTSFTLTVTSSDERPGVAYYQYCYPGSDGVCEESEWKTYNGSVRTDDDLETGEYTFVTPVFSIQRSEKVAIRAVDKAENKSDPEFFQINIDKDKPSCDITLKGTLNGEVYVSTVDVLLSSMNDTGGSELVEYGLSDSATVTYNSETTGIQNNAPDGITWYGFVKDGAGNTNTCSKTFTIQESPPTITFSVSGVTSTAICTDSTTGEEIDSWEETIDSETTTHTVTCTDSNGTSTSCSQNYTYTEEEKEAYSCSCPGSCSACADITGVCYGCCGYCDTYTEKTATKNGEATCS